ncbi:MAG: hypothetical protein ACKV2T_32895 [Kofleriaceae bacterium]
MQSEFCRELALTDHELVDLEIKNTARCDSPPRVRPASTNK